MAKQGRWRGNNQDRDVEPKSKEVKLDQFIEYLVGFLLTGSFLIQPGKLG